MAKMRKGGGKQKGAAFERLICKALSLWVTGGKRGDVFWRSAMSGGRATIYTDVRQCGDICAVAPEGAPLVERYFIECKAYRDLQIGSWVITDKGNLAQFWKETKDQAEIHHREPLLIFRQNGWPTMMLSLRSSYHPRDERLAVVVRDAVVRPLEDVLMSPYSSVYATLPGRSKKSHSK
jgi:hypothetical protein